MAEQRSYTGGFTNRWKFTGKELDEETGLYYFGARFYNPVTSLWLSVDPLAEKYPSMSPYNYCANNPIKYIDPDGRDIIIANCFGLKEFTYKDGKVYRYNSSRAPWEGLGEELNVNTLGDHVALVVQTLDEIRANSAGKTEIIDYFQQYGNDITVDLNPDSPDGDNYFEGVATFTGKNVSLRTTGPPGEANTPPFIALGHEMAHEKFNKLYPWGTGISWDPNILGDNPVPFSEIYTTHIENKMRNSGGLHLRTHYGPGEATRILHPNSNESRVMPKNGVIPNDQVKRGLPKGEGHIYNPTTFPTKNNIDLKN